MPARIRNVDGFVAHRDMPDHAGTERAAVTNLDVTVDRCVHGIADEFAALMIDAGKGDEFPAELGVQCVDNALKHRPQGHVLKGNARDPVERGKLSQHFFGGSTHDAALVANRRHRNAAVNSTPSLINPNSFRIACGDCADRASQPPPMTIACNTSTRA